MKIPFTNKLFTTCLASVLLAASAQAQSVTTDPVGAITLTLKGSSDTLVSLPFQRPTALETQVSSISGNVISIAASANVTGNQFVYSSGNQTNTYYLQFTTGNRKGMFYTVTANTPTNITVDPNGDAGLSGNVGTGDTFRVIPYWTLNTIFPAGQGINGSPGPAANQRNSSILFLPNNTPGINLVPAAIFYYYNGTSGGGAGWRQVGATFSTIQNDTIVYPDSYFVVRNSIAGDTTLTLVGAVPMAAYSTPISTLANNQAQDIFIGVSAPVPVTLGASNLVSSGAFLPSSSPAANQRNDQLLVFNTGVAGFNRQPSGIYYYYNGTAGGGAGWRLAGDVFTNIYDNTTIFQPGQAYILRKKATATPQTVIWSFTPSYLLP